MNHLAPLSNSNESSDASATRPGDQGTSATHDNAGDVAVSEQERLKAEARRRQLKGLRKKNRLSRHIRGKGDRKSSSFDHEAFRLENSLPEVQTQQQVRHTLMLTKQRSPVKSEVKRQRKYELREKRKSMRKVASLVASAEKSRKKIKLLQTKNKYLMQELLRERRVSNQMIDDAIRGARVLTQQALQMMCGADEKAREAEHKVLQARQDAKESVRKERKVSSRQSARLRSKHCTAIAKVQEKTQSELAKAGEKIIKVKSKLSSVQTKLRQQRSEWQNKCERMDMESYKKLSNERKRRRDVARRHLDKASATEDQLQELIDGLNIMNDELAKEVEDAKKSQRNAEKKYKDEKKLSKNRLTQRDHQKATVRELNDELARVLRAQSQQQQTIERYEQVLKENASKKKSLKKEYEAGRRGGGRWPLWVVEVCCELLVQGTPPNAIPASVGTMYEIFYGEEAPDLPSSDFVRQCRVLIQIIGETITAMKLAACEDWLQIFFDATTRRQVPFSAVIISLMGDNPHSLDPVIVSSCVITEDETAENQVEGIIAKIESLKPRLDHFRDVASRMCPELLDTIPDPAGIAISKLGNHGSVTTDTCNAAQAARRIFQERIGGITYVQDCLHHLRNVWIKGMEKLITGRLRVILKDSMEEIAPELRVNCVFAAFARAWDKFFSLSANYPKGQGEHFASWLKKNKPGVPLYHVEGASGSRHDLCLMAAPAIYMNRSVCFDYAWYLLGLPKKQDNILLRNLYILMTSEEMIALSRLLSILYISFCLPMRWLAGKTPELAEYSWGPVSNGRAMDTLREKMMELEAEPKLSLDEDFMMGMFREYIDELPPMKEYWTLMFEKKKLKVIASESGATILQFDQLRKELFNPVDESNKRTAARVIELAKFAAQGILTELHDEKKATRKYLSFTNSPHSWVGSSDEAKKNLLGREATNDRSESALGGATSQIQMFGRIGLTNAAAVSDMKRNGYFQRFTKKSGGTKGMFHQFPQELRECLLMMAIEAAPDTMSHNREELEKQREAKRKKEEMLREAGLLKAQEKLIESAYYHRMYNSLACWKGDPKIVSQMLKRIQSESGKIEALKENIRIRVIGFDWDEFKIPWQVKGVKKTVKELSKHLRGIIAAEKDMEIPKEPEIKGPSRPDMAVLGTSTKQREVREAQQDFDEIKLRKDAEKLRRERESRGKGSMYAELQPFYRPELNELMNERIDVLVSFDVKDGKELRWCQGEVIKVYDKNKTTKPTVRVQWDPMPDVEGEDKVTESDYALLPSKWKKDVDGAWRMDVNIEIVDNCDSDEDTDDEENIPIAKLGCGYDDSDEDSDSEPETSDGESGSDDDNVESDK